MDIIAEFQGEHHESLFGSHIVSLDYNHDGYTDMIVLAGAFGFHPGVSSSRGKVYIYYGGHTFSSNTVPSVTLDYGVESNRCILSIENVGDVNGDGFEDLCIVTAIRNVSESNMAQFYWGGTDSLETPDVMMPIADSQHYAVSKLGDLDGDGFDDVGLVYTTPAPYVTKFVIIWGGSLMEQVVFEQPFNNALRAICGIGDINADGYKDFTLGLTNPDPYTGYHMIRIYYGNPSFNFTPGWLGDVEASGLKYGDLNGDGFDDVIGTKINERSFSVWMGRAQMNGTSDLIITRYVDSFGSCVSTGDFNADGFCDVAVSAPWDDDGPSQNFPGYIWVYGGNAQLADTTVELEDEHTPPISEMLTVNISPNPVRNPQGSVRVRALIKDHATSKDAKISIYNIKGQLVHSANVPLTASAMVHDFYLTQSPNGLYLCKVTVGKISSTKKIQVLK